MIQKYKLGLNFNVSLTLTVLINWKWSSVTSQHSTQLVTITQVLVHWTVTASACSVHNNTLLDSSSVHIARSIFVMTSKWRQPAIASWLTSKYSQHILRLKNSLITFSFNFHVFVITDFEFSWSTFIIFSKRWRNNKRL